MGGRPFDWHEHGSWDFHIESACAIFAGVPRRQVVYWFHCHTPGPQRGETGVQHLDVTRSSRLVSVRQVGSYCHFKSSHFLAGYHTSLSCSYPDMLDPLRVPEEARREWYEARGEQVPPDDEDDRGGDPPEDDRAGDDDDDEYDELDGLIEAGEADVDRQSRGLDPRPDRVRRQVYGPPGPSGDRATIFTWEGGTAASPAQVICGSRTYLHGPHRVVDQFLAELISSQRSQKVVQRLTVHSSPIVVFSSEAGAADLPRDAVAETWDELSWLRPALLHVRPTLRGDRITDANAWLAKRFATIDTALVKRR